MTLDASGNLGVGTNSPGGYKLAIGDGSSNRGRIMLKGATSGNYPEINIDDTMNSGGKNYQVYSTGGQLKVVNSTDSAVSFVANGAGIGLGDISAVDGKGIRFPATQSASSDANTLDDYEEGTWTPALDLTAGSATGGTFTGTYVKVGRQVTLTIYASVGTATSATFGGFTGLPFTSENVNQKGTGALRENNSTGNLYVMMVNTNSTTSVCRRYDNNTTVSSSMIFMGSVTYFTA
jgi:hypothetical protein